MTNEQLEAAFKARTPIRCRKMLGFIVGIKKTATRERVIRLEAEVVLDAGTKAHDRGGVYEYLPHSVTLRVSPREVEPA